MKNNVKVIILIIIALVITNYFQLFTLNVRYSEFYTVLIILVDILIVKFVLGNLDFLKKINLKDQTIIIDDQITDAKKKQIKGVVKILFAVTSLIIILPIVSSPIFFSKQYSQLIGEVKNKPFQTDFSNPELNELPIVDSQYAKLLGDKKLGSTSGLGSEFHVGNYTDIVYNGEYYITAPLEYNDIFKWLNNRKKGTPGYILINKSTAKVDLIMSDDVRIKYTDSAYLNQDLKRTAYFGGGWNNKISEPFFEIDEDGKPYYIYAKTKKTIGVTSGEDVYQIIVVNANSGETDLYDVGTQPDWIDNVYPAQLIVDQLNYFGKYQSGFLNSLFSQEGLLQTTRGERHIFNDDILSLYSGMTSIGSDESTVGMAFVNVSTKDAVVYSLTGATEDAAMKSAEGKVQNLKYTAAFPIPVSINDEGAYFITLKDAEGLIKQYAFVNITDYSIVENDSDITQAYLNYVERMGYKEDVIDSELIKEQKAKVVRISLETIDGKSRYVLLVDVEGTNYMYFANNISDELAITQEGDEIKFKSQKDAMLEFDNLDIEYKISDE